MCSGVLEVGLADAEIDDVAALRGERIRARQHREGVLLADAVEIRDGLQHGVSSFFLPLAPRSGERVDESEASGRVRGCCRTLSHLAAP